MLQQSTSKTAIATLVLATTAISGCMTRTQPASTLTQNVNQTDSHWSQAGGPNYNWQAIDDYDTPTSWSVSRSENILWQTELPNAGQSGIAVWQDRLFLTTFAPGEGHGLPQGKRWSSKIQGHCVDRNTGKILWSVDLKGDVKSPIMYAFSDSTSPTPVTDGERVIFTNASGEMAAFDFDGRELWRRSFSPWTPKDKFPFNKQHEPILYQDVVLHVEPLDDHRSLDNKAYFGWNFLRGIDKYTGKTKWIAKDASTTYTTSVMGYTKSGEPAVLTGRGGPHGVPERPVGVSLLSLRKENAGEVIWRFAGNTDKFGKLLAEPGSVGYPTWQALFNMHWDQDSTYLFKGAPNEAVVEIDSKTGEIINEFPLSQKVDYRPWDNAEQRHEYYRGVNLHKLRDWSPRTAKSLKSKKTQRLMKGKDLTNVGMYVFPAWHSNIKVGDYLYFLTGTSHTRNKELTKRGLLAGPSHSVGRLNTQTGQVEFLELPSSLSPSGQYLYGEALHSEVSNSAGVEVANEPRSRTDGWSVAAFWGSPSVINNKLFFTTMGGLTYVIDAQATILDAEALLSVNDLGEVGKTWTANSISYAKGTLYHRSAKRLVAIKNISKQLN